MSRKTLPRINLVDELCFDNVRHSKHTGGLKWSQNNKYLADDYCNENENDELQ